MKQIFDNMGTSKFWLPLCLLLAAAAAAGLLLVQKPSAEPVAETTQPLQTSPSAVADTLALETETTVPDEPTAVVSRKFGDEGPVEYETLRLDKSHRINHEPNTIYYCDYIVLLEDSPACEAINQDIYQIAEAFMSEKTQEEIVTPHYIFDTIKHHFHHVNQFWVTHNGDGIISFQVDYMGFWGGDEEYYEPYGLTYSLRTGERLALADLFDTDEDTLLQTLHSRIVDYMGSVIYPLEAFTRSPDSYALDEYLFWIKDGQVILTFHDYQTQQGNSVVYVPTGLYI